MGAPMRCSNCGTDNAVGSRFCNQCASPLGRRCAKCSFDNSYDAKFCSQCAEPLHAGAPTTAQPRAARIVQRVNAAI